MGFSELNGDVIRYIIGFLDGNSALRLSLTSKRIRSIFDNVKCISYFERVFGLLRTPFLNQRMSLIKQVKDERRLWWLVLREVMKDVFIRSGNNYLIIDRKDEDYEWWQTFRTYHTPLARTRSPLLNTCRSWKKLMYSKEIHQLFWKGDCEPYAFAFRAGVFLKLPE